MAVSFWFTNHLILFVATIVLFGIIYFTKLGSNKAIVVIFGALGVCEIFVGYRYISLADAAASKVLDVKDVNSVADIKMWSAALAALGLGVIYTAYKKYKLA